jgi:hypothetical protein
LECFGQRDDFLRRSGLTNAGKNVPDAVLVGIKGRCILNWPWLVAYFSGGVLAANAIPHFVAGTMGRPFQTSFAKPPGKGLSASTVNVVWGFFNAIVGYLVHVGAFNLRATSHMLALGLGMLLISLNHARQFGQFHVGNTPSRT